MSSPASSRPAPTPRPRRRLRRVLAFALGCVLTAVLAEGGLRFALFSDLPAVVRATDDLRQPELFASAYDDVLYWKLVHRWSRGGRPDPPHPDPKVGWRSFAVRPDYSHITPRHREDARALLLYGDSFAACTTKPLECFEGFFERTPAGEDFVFYNYGTGGFGLDQAFLMMRESIGHYVHREPVVVLSFLVDDDLDRTILDFRSWPKLAGRVVDGELVFDFPETSNADEYVADHPPSATSWVWRLARGAGLFPGSSERAAAEARASKQELTRAILATAKEELDALDVEWFVLLFHSLPFVQATEPRNWKEPFVLETMRELGIRHVDTRPDLWEAALELGIPVSELYFSKTHRRGHLNPVGNEAALRTILRGLAGEADPYEYQPGPRASGEPR